MRSSSSQNFLLFFPARMELICGETSQIQTCGEGIGASSWKSPTEEYESLVEPILL